MREWVLIDVGGALFDPLGQSSTATHKIVVPSFDINPDESPETLIHQMEKKVNQLLEESIDANSRGDHQLVHNINWCRINIITQALDRAKEASKKERMLCKQREQMSLTDQINLDLTYLVS